MAEGSAMFMGMVFLAVVLSLGGIYSLIFDVYLRDRGKFSQRIDDEFKKKKEKVKKSTLFKNLSQLAGEAGSEIEPSLSP